MFRAVFTKIRSRALELEIDSIEQDQVEEIEQKCRDVLSAAWVSPQHAPLSCSDTDACYRIETQLFWRRRNGWEEGIEILLILLIATAGESILLE